MEREKITILEKLLVRMEHGDLKKGVSQAEVRTLRQALTELMQELDAKEGFDEEIEIFKEYSKKHGKKIEMDATDFDDFLRSRKEGKKS
jgi:hypothetical protein